MKTVDVYWSHQSPYCYFALDRLLKLNQRSDVTLRLKPVLPGVIRDGGLFDDRPEIEQRYFDLDVQRTADFLGLPYSEPDPYPVQTAPDSLYRAEGDQSRVFKLYYLTAAANSTGQGWKFLDIVARLIWDGSTTNWHLSEVMSSAFRTKGMDLAKLESVASGRSKKFDAIFAANRDSMLAAGHWGVPCFVYEGEPFYGQDRIDQLCWRLGS